MSSSTLPAALYELTILATLKLSEKLGDRLRRQHLTMYRMRTIASITQTVKTKKIRKMTKAFS
jgi:hypothetical protein